MRDGVKRWLAGMLLTWSGAAMASPADVMLTVRGGAGMFNDAGRSEYRFTESELLRLPQRTITTRTTWTPKSVFSGPGLSDILRAVGARGSKIELVTYDEYKVILPLSDLDKYHPIIARFINGKPLERRDFGPLWVMYPVSDFAELQKVKADAKLAWQIKTIVVR